MVTIAESNVKPIMMQTLAFVEDGICSLQNAEIGTVARIMSVMVVHALTQ
jgi:hypothetical protein